MEQHHRECSKQRSLQRRTSVRIFFGNKKVSTLPDVLKQAGARRVVCVLSGSAKRSNARTLDSVLAKISKQCAVTIIVPERSSVSSTWLARTARVLPKEVDTFIAIGGGSIMDATKVLAIASSTGRTVRDLLADPLPNDFKRRGLLVMIPTTYASGSETSQGAVVVDDATGMRTNIKGLFSCADVSIIDPGLLSPDDRYHRIAAFDVFSHAVEGYFSRRASAATRRMCIDVMRSVASLTRRIQAGKLRRSDREELAYHGTLMGIVLQRASTCLPHRISYALPKRIQYRISHAEATALVYPAWLRNLERRAPHAVRVLSQALGTDAISFIMGVRTQLRLEDTFDTVGILSRERRAIIARCRGNLADDPSYDGKETLGEVVFSS